MSDIDFVVLWVDSCDPSWQKIFLNLKGRVNIKRVLSIPLDSEIWGFSTIGSDVWKNTHHG